MHDHRPGLRCLILLLLVVACASGCSGPAGNSPDRWDGAGEELPPVPTDTRSVEGSDTVADGAGSDGGAEQEVADGTVGDAGPADGAESDPVDAAEPDLEEESADLAPEEICEALDEDCDGLVGAEDNCPGVANPEQADADEDGAGDPCDPDDDNDGVPDGEDLFPLDPTEWADSDGDGLGDNADTETCDGLDNDGDGEVDEGLPVFGSHPDSDGDGYGAGAGSSCSSLLADGFVEDGLYTIRPLSYLGPEMEVFCDMTTDGGGWTRVFYHDVSDGYFLSDEDAHASNVDDPLNGRYSILHLLEEFRSADGTFELRIEWPETVAPGRNVWRQESNPTTAPVTGYEAISVDHLEYSWGGLELSDRAETYLDGSVGHPYWFYSIGSQVPWSNPPGIPSYELPVERVALWVRPDDDVAGGEPAFDCNVPPGYAVLGGDCDDTRDWVYPGAPEVCDGLDSDCDGLVDEECPFGSLAFEVLPQPLHFYARDLSSNTCAVTLSGTTEGAATQAQVVITRDGEPYLDAAADGSPFTFELTLDGGLYLYDIAVNWDDGSGFWKPVTEVKDVLCGDVFLVNGQSNAVALDYQNESLGDLETTTFVRSYGSSVKNAGVVNDESFGIAVADAGYTHAAVGQWGLQLARAVMEEQGIPILVINGAYGGTKVAQHQRNDNAPDDVNTIYGRLLWRAQHAGVADRVRAIFWHQGESDGNMAYQTYLDLWIALYEDWLEDYPNVEGIYPFQVRAGCGTPTWNRNVHRDLPNLLPLVIGHMSTTGVAGHDGCHFYHASYVEWGERMARLVNRDLYGTDVPGHIEAPDPVTASWLSETELEIEFGESGGGMVLEPGAEAWFSLSDGATVVSATVVGQTVVLTTAGPSTASWVSFVDSAGDIPWLVNDLGIGSFAWYQLPIGTL